MILDGKAAADHSCDWNAPEEHWGNYEEPPVLVTPAPPLKEPPVPNKVPLTLTHVLSSHPVDFSKSTISKAKKCL